MECFEKHKDKYKCSERIRGRKSAGNAAVTEKIDSFKYIAGHNGVLLQKECREYAFGGKNCKFFEKNIK